MGRSLEFLRFAALSCAVHADAAQCLVDDTQAALRRVAADAERLAAAENKLDERLGAQRRLKTLREALRRSRGARAAAAAAGPSKGAAATPAGVKDALRFASSAVEGDDVFAVETAAGRGRRSVPIEEGEGEEKTIDDEVEELKLEIKHLERMSIKTKLRELEALKNHVKNVDVNAVIERYVGSFSFSEDVEKLWNANNALNSKNIDIFMDQACQRFSTRYEDALTAISDFPLHEKSDPAQVFNSLLYANALTSSLNSDASAVRTLQSLGTDSLVQYYRRKKHMATVDTPIGSSRPDTVLGPEEFSVFPEDWWNTQLLFPPQDTYLPPAKHILTPRFSFADVDELKTLESLRVDFQRDVLNTLICLPEAMKEVWRQRRVESAQEDDERDINASLVRLTVDKANNSGAVWTTIAHRTLEN